ncbi:MAG: hypothetical protein L6V35_06335 [Alistipes putredinis]|nr:MAG: hypothetical protein L6V35_06335 [Alistipes putredinis]
MTQDTEQKGQGQIPLHGYITYAEALRLIADAIGNLKNIRFRGRNNPSAAGGTESRNAIQILT